MSGDDAITAATIEIPWTIWRRQPGTIMVPDMICRWRRSHERTICRVKRAATPTAWFGDSPET